MLHKTIFLILVTGCRYLHAVVGEASQGVGADSFLRGMGRGLRRGSPLVMHTYKAGGKHGKTVLTLAQ